MDEKAMEERLREFRRDADISMETIDADCAHMLSQGFASRAEEVDDRARAEWVDARRRAFAAFRAYKAEHGQRGADYELWRRYERRWEAAKAAYRAFLASRRALAAARELVLAAEAAH